MAARALEFAILTACRSGEVLSARWGEIDLDKAIWTIPAQRMKAGKEHRVPLSDRAVTLLTALRKTRTSDFVFPGTAAGKPLSAPAMAMQLRRMREPEHHRPRVPQLPRLVSEPRSHEVCEQR